MIIWVSHAWSWYWYVHAACGVLSCFKLEARIPLNYVLLCDCLEPIIDDFIRPECCKRQSNFYIAIRWDSAQWSLACLECHTSVCTLHCCQIFFFFTKCLLGESLVKLEIKNILSKIAEHEDKFVYSNFQWVPFGWESKNWQSKNLLSTRAIAAHIRVKILTPFI